MKFSVIIVSYNSRDEVFDCIRSVREIYGADHENSAEIIVVDNASTDGTADLLATEPGILFIRNSVNEGFTKACNQGAARAQGRFLLFLNPDTLLVDDCLHRMAAVFESSPEVALVGPVSNAAAGIQNIRNFHPEPIQSVHINNRYAISRFLQEKYAGQSEWAPIVVGFCLMVRRSFFSDIGGMDEELVLGMDDLDISWRVQLLGKKGMVAKDAFVYHHSQKSFQKAVSEQVEKMQWRSHTAFSRKLAHHYGSLEMVPDSEKLWKMDWFHVCRQDDIEKYEAESGASQGAAAREQGPSDSGALNQAGLNTGGSVNGEQLVWCIIARERDSVGHICAALDNAADRGAEDILLINSSRETIPDSYLDRGVDEWKFSGAARWGLILKKIQKFHRDVPLLFVRAGVLSDSYSIRNLMSWCEENGGAKKVDGCYGTLLDLVNSRALFDQNEPFFLGAEVTLNSLELPWFCLLPDCGKLEQNLVWVADAQLQSENTEQILELPAPSSQPTQTVAAGNEISSAAVQSSAQTSQNELGQSTAGGTPVRPEDFPHSLQKLLKEFPSTVFWGKSQVLDLNGNAADVHNAELVVVRAGMAEIPGLHLLLQEFKHKNLKKVALVFDNTGFQDPMDAKPFPKSGYTLYDARRELELSGYFINSVSSYEDNFAEVNENYLGHYSPHAGLSADEMLMFQAPKIVVEAEPCALEHHLEEKVSIVLLALNKVEYTRKCIESVQRNTRQNIEWILVNNGSTDGTREYFDSVPGAIVIHNEKNLGVAAGWNQGIEKATGKYVLILNNDTIVAPDTIENLVRTAVNHSDAGIVGPRSNNIAGPQLVKNFEFSSDEEIEQKAQEYQKTHSLSCWEFSRIKGFCMLVPMSVIHQIGTFDEAFGMGNFEDDDFSCRVRFAGFRTLVADDSFLFHYGSVSFGQAGVDWSEQMKLNMKLFEDKWEDGRESIDKALTASLPVDSLPGDFGPGWDALRDNEWQEAIQSFQQALQFQASDARAHFGLGLALSRSGNHTDGFASYCRSLELDSTQEDVAREVVSHLHENFEESAIQETLNYLAGRHPHLDAFRQLTPHPQMPLTLEWKAQVEQWLEQKDFDSALTYLKSRLQNGEESYEVYNFLGITRYYQEVYDEAFQYFEKALHFNPVDSDALLNYYDCGLRLRTLSKVEQALEYARSLEKDIPGVESALLEIKAIQKDSAQNGQYSGTNLDKVIYYREMNIGAENLIREGLLEKAQEVLEGLLEESPENYRALNNMGLIFWYSGRVNESWKCFTQAVDKNPWYLDAVVNMYDCAIVSGNQEEFRPILQKALSISPLNTELREIEQELNEDRIPDRLKQYFDESIQEEGRKQKIEKAQGLVEAQNYNAAVLLYSEVLDEDPDNLESYNGLGVISFYRGEYEDAFKLFSHSLKLSPLDQDSLLNFWDAAKRTGRALDARPVLENAVSIDPGLELVQQALNESM